LVPSVEGMQTALNLVKKPFEALVEGKPYYSSGFWKTGVQPTVSIDFKSGRMLTLTEDHKVMTTLGWKKAKELTSNDSIVIHNHRDFNPKIDIASEDYARGYCLGNFLADGNISKDSAQMKWWGEEKDEYRKDGLALLEQANWKNNHHILDQNTIAVYATIGSKKLFNFAKEKGCLNGEKSLSPQSLEGSWSYLSGLISGYFDADGTIRVDFKKGNSVRFTSANLENLKLLQIGLNAFGIFSNIYLNRNPEGNRHLPDGKGGHQDYYCQAIHELVIACDSISRFSELILIRNKNKQNNLLNIVNGYQRMPNRTHFVDHIINKTFNGIQDVYDCEVTEVHAFDANSIYVHNCCEINLYAYDDEGNSGWAFCNLCEINGKKIKCREDFAIAARGAAILGTLQAGYTTFDYLGPISEKIIRREALLGVSITGMMDSPDIIFDPEMQKEMALLIVKTNEWMAKKIGINPAARTTCVKPSGCQSPDTIIRTKDGDKSLNQIFIDNGHNLEDYKNKSNIWLETKIDIFVFNENNKLEKITKLYVNGVDEMVEFYMEDGTKMKCTPWHKFKLTDGSWKRADQLEINDDILNF
jgi:intein/homing endonuclease